MEDEQYHLPLFLNWTPKMFPIHVSLLTGPVGQSSQPVVPGRGLMTGLLLVGPRPLEGKRRDELGQTFRAPLARLSGLTVPLS